jgi:hypothetical protein
LIKRPPVFTRRCCKVVSDQASISACCTQRRNEIPLTVLEHCRMERKTFGELFRNKTTEVLTITCLADWRQTKEGSRLLLPPIQRSVVWTNEQVINYWDSLLRGYSPGMMLVHRVQKEGNNSGSKGRDADGTTREANEEDFQLFDGQQRMAAVLLGLGSGQMKGSRKLWVDLGTEPEKSSGLRFQLRVTSTGQPFGYRPNAPNQKIELYKRQSKWEQWRENKDGHLKPQQAFADATGVDLIDATCAVSFADICNALREKKDRDATIAELSKLKGFSNTRFDEFVGELEKALECQVIIQLVDPKIVADREEYIRFFTRLG